MINILPLTQTQNINSRFNEVTALDHFINTYGEDEDLENWAKEYPDVAAIVETIAMKKAKEQSDAINEKLKQIDELNAQNAKEKAEVELLRIHPDFADIRESDDFHQWAE